ncbi:hypothetical protein G6O69_17525 [Pseudenhygromyxa sp. WMMC2535]|uniref:hypothetical protein n=1 Tax=Pseudenhygromyxa sp. WMMC2535 TaxID=2712867 RepID=UPI001553A7F6|nr:hypothetical protein [Pseudenhygromyxa sp. WMMC2535]NVB39647.1 hypothetical protein [Pseudenhygromyxa sp. WMMC2535]
MADPALRFRRLPPPRVGARAKDASAPEKADASQAPRGERSTQPEHDELFAHYGVAVRQQPGELAAIVDARACRGCGWRLVSAGEDPPRCPVCGLQ